MLEIKDFYNTPIHSCPLNFSLSLEVNSEEVGLDKLILISVFASKCTHGQIIFINSFSIFILLIQMLYEVATLYMFFSVQTGILNVPKAIYIFI